jgi:hypothetical protein
MRKSLIRTDYWACPERTECENWSRGALKRRTHIVVYSDIEDGWRERENE